MDMALGQADFRDNRRRRVLQEEARRSGQCAPPPVQEGARYTDAAGVENHPQITQFIPRRYRTYVLGLFLAAAAIGLVGSLHWWAAAMARALGNGPIAAIDLAAGGGLACWFASIVLVGVAAVAWMIYTLRRHRVDDYKARYRLWMWTAAAALVASADSVARLHEPWSDLWVSVTGWSAASPAVWWLAPLGLVGAWLAVRLVMETAECRGACSLVVVGIAAYGLATAAALGALSSAVGRFEPIIVASALLAGHVLALTACTLYARYVVLDVQGLIVHPAKPSPEGEQRPSDRAASARSDHQPDHGNQKPRPATLPIDTHMQRQRSDLSGRDAREWTDGSEPDDGSEDNRRPHRKLSKAERKRLRKQRRKCA